MNVTNPDGLAQKLARERAELVELVPDFQVELLNPSAPRCGVAGHLSRASDGRHHPGARGRPNARMLDVVRAAARDVRMMALITT